MAGRSWTELFFLDEAVAFAAGHHPCFLRRREAAGRFREFWVSAKGELLSAAVAMDATLRTDGLRGRKRLHPIDTRLAELHDGAIVAVGNEAFTLRAGRAHHWTSERYAPPQRLAGAGWLPTPPSTVMALQAGYQAVFRLSINTSRHRPHHARSV